VADLDLGRACGDVERDHEVVAVGRDLAVERDGRVGARARRGQRRERDPEEEDPRARAPHQEVNALSRMGSKPPAPAGRFANSTRPWFRVARTSIPPGMSLTRTGAPKFAKLETL